MKKQKVLIVVSNYYKDIADELVKGATEYLDSRKDKEVFVGDGIDVEYSIHKVPGAFEIPFVINIYRYFRAMVIVGLFKSKFLPNWMVEQLFIDMYSYFSYVNLHLIYSIGKV